MVGIVRKDKAGHMVRVTSEKWSVVEESIPEAFPISNSAVGIHER